MTQTEFSDEEIRVLKDVIESYVTGMASQLYGLDALSLENTEELIHKREVLEEVLERIEHNVA